MARTTDEAFRHMIEIAKDAGLTLLSSQWMGTKANYLFRCRQGHEFERSAVVIARGTTTCPMCTRAATRQLFFDRLEQRGVVCLESDYLGPLVRHRLRCKFGHSWSPKGHGVLEGRGCPSCAKARVAVMNMHADGLERLCEAAAKRGGRCLSDRYSGVDADYEWACAKGHSWYAQAINVLEAPGVGPASGFGTATGCSIQTA